MKGFLFFIVLVFPSTTGFFFTSLFTTTSKSSNKIGPATTNSYCSFGFSSLQKSKNFSPHVHFNNVFLKMSNKDEDDNNNNEDGTAEMSELDTQILSKVQNHFKSNLLYTFHLTNHKPLGCTAEESLVQGEDGEKFVFISKLVAGGYAATAGLEVGDLIVGLSGTFDLVEDTFGEGLDRVRSLVAGRPEEEELTIKIIRNTDVMQKHESALVDLCTLPEGQLNMRDKNIETCIETMYKAGYEIDDVEGIENSCDDDDLECMFDQLNDIWEEEYNYGTKKDEGDEGDSSTEKEEVKKPAPWSSRSSPSGTFVRVNGTMINIDE